MPTEYFISKMIPPEYPEVARQEGLEAIVFVEITVGDDMAVNSAELKTVIVGRPPLEVVKVGKDGKVVEPVEEEGMDAYHEVFTQAALEAALQWAIEVRPEGTQPDSITLVVPIQFRLERNEDKEGEEVDEDGAEYERARDEARDARAEAKRRRVEAQEVRVALQRSRVEAGRAEAEAKRRVLEETRARIERERAILEAEGAEAESGSLEGGESEGNDSM